MEENLLVKFIFAKHNELESMKKFIKDEHVLDIIKAKQDTLNDMQAILDSQIASRILSM